MSEEGGFLASLSGCMVRGKSTLQGVMTFRAWEAVPGHPGDEGV